MDRKVLLAMVLIMLVLLADQMLLPKFYRPKRKPTVAQQGGPTAPQASGGTPGVSGSPAGSAYPTGTGAPGPPTAPQAALSSGAVLATPRVQAEPILEREIQTEHFKATFTSQGASIEHWVLESYRDAIRKAPV